MPIASTEHHDTTAGEREVLLLVAIGSSNKEIARRLGLDRRTVETRLQRFCSRTLVSGRLLVVWSIDHNHCCLVNPIKSVVITQQRDNVATR